MNACDFHVLPGLPAYGDPARAFSANGMGTQSEGLVVRFAPTETQSWIGNFVPGSLTKFQLLVPHPDGHDTIIIAGGQGYRLDPFSQRLVETFGGAIVDAFAHPTVNAIVLNHQNLQFEAIGPAGRIWITRRLSWDQIRGIERNGTTVTGEAWRPDDSWHPFRVDLQTGSVEGGSYPDRE